MTAAGTAIGSANAAAFFVTVPIAAAFFAALVARHVPARPPTIVVALVLLALAQASAR